jgi:signal transduction histidine kinase/DNA-binding response OmpR family regulator/predicted RNA-binding protein with RPS1 domain
MSAEKNRTLVHVHVTRHTLQGLYVTLDNGESGIIRTREISWNNKDIMQWRDIYPIGWDGYAFRIPTKKGEIPELSLRLVEYDPWDDFFDGLEKDQVFVGTVTGIYDYGAFLEIEDGITGLLRKSQLPQKMQASLPDIFWHGDKVAIIIREVDHEQRHIGFSLAPAQNLAEGKLPIERHSLAGGPEVEFNLDQLLNSKFPHNYILVVEDEPSQSAAICGWLRSFGQGVEALTSAEDALEFLSKSKPNIVMADVGLPGMSGTELAQIILSRHPQVQVVTMTDWARANEIHPELTKVQMQGGKLLYKPFLPEDLANYLLFNQDHGSFAGEAAQEHPRKHPANTKSSWKDIHHLLTKCQKKLGMEQVFLFALDPAHRHISIADRASDSIGNKSAIAQLIYSPVRDAAEDGEEFFIGKIGEKEHKRFQHFLEFAPTTTSCIGIPISENSSLKYALFAMDRRAREFSNETKMYVEGVALSISAILNQITLKEQATLIQRSALLGNLTSGMIHEINNLVSPLLLNVNHLRRSFADVDKESDHETLKIEITGIEREIRQMVSTVKTFGNIAKKPQTEILKVDEIINNTIKLLLHPSKRAKTNIIFDPPERIVIVRNQAVLLEQIIMNVSLNAIQQISEYRTEGGGCIRIDIELLEETRDDANCRILIHDNGPGIHASLWEKIFEMGYSTRQDGSGIGLYVSRNLMEEIDGKIYVADSRILSGSTFALEFPVHF